MADPALLLAGPIVRRVEPTLVSVWVALRRPRALALTVFEDRQQAGLEPTPFTGGSPVAEGAANTLRVGEQLHIGVVVAKLGPDNALVPGRNYSYNVGFGAFVTVQGRPSDAATLTTVQVQPTADLRSLGLLDNAPIDGHAHLALGFDPGELPGFALPPPELTNLRILHGSCRRPGYTYEDLEGDRTFDGLAWVDDLIARWRSGAPTEGAFNPDVRPHQLVLTGDQIYADDVAAPLLPMLNRVGNELLGTVERFPTRYPPANDAPSKELYLGAPAQEGFATMDAFHRAMKDASKDPVEELRRDPRVRVLQDPCFAIRYELLYQRTFAVDAGLTAGPDGVTLWPADLDHFPPGLRARVMDCEARFSSVDLASHLMSFGEYCAMYLVVLSPAAWELNDGRPSLATAMDIFRLPSAPLSQIWDIHGFVEDDKEKWFARTDRDAFSAYLKGRAEDEGTAADFRRTIDTLNAFYDSLPRVRRALANIPTYMIFDDHDVTDDWNINRAWRDQVYGPGSPLGRRIVTSALVAYALFQDWGNNPLRYREASARELIDLISQLWPAGVDLTPPAEPIDLLGKRLGLDQVDPESPPPGLTWHFTIDGPRHRIVALDTRTRRHFRSRYSPPGLLTPTALDEQLPDPFTSPLPTGVDVLLVVSPTPVVMPALASALILPLTARNAERKHRDIWRNTVGIDPDDEIWATDQHAYLNLLGRLAAFRRVVVLSGEVHWGFSGQLSYWQQGELRLVLPNTVAAELDRGELSATARERFAAVDLLLGPAACVGARDIPGEWLVIDLDNRRMFLVRAEVDGLHAFTEEEPARVAQFTSSGLKNVHNDIAAPSRQLGFAFPMIDLVPAERLIWNDKTPVPLTPPPGGRFPVAARAQIGAEPVLLPSRTWPAGTKMTRLPDACWRSDLVRDERPDDGVDRRPEFARADPLPAFSPSDVVGSYQELAAMHTKALDKLRFARGPMYQCNLGLVRFERAGADLVARHDLYSHPPGRDEAVLVSAYRVALQAFGERRPGLRFEQADGA